MASKEQRRTHSIRAAVTRAGHFVATVRQQAGVLRARLPSRVKRLIRRTTHVSLHSILGVLLAIALVFVLAWWWLPVLGERKGEIESLVSSEIGSPVTIERLDTFWDGLNPGVRVQGVRLAGTAHTEEAALRLREMRLSLAWWPLLTGNIRIGNLTLVEPEIVVERLAEGGYRLGGLGRARSSNRPSTDMTEWLLVQHEIAIENASVEWRDHLSGKTKGVPEVMKIEGLTASIVNRGSLHRLEVQAKFPQALCRQCRLTAEIDGNPFSDTAWKGTLRLMALGFSVQELPAIARERVPPGFDGKFDLDLDSRWQDRRPVSIEGGVAVTGLKLPVTNMPVPLEMKHAAARVDWRGRADTWQLDISRLKIGLTRAVWPAGRISVERSPDRLKLKVERMEVDDLARFAASLPQEDKIFTWLRAARPEGLVSNLTAEVKSGPVPADFRITADVSNVSFAAHERVPGLAGLAGRVSLSRDGGEFRLASTGLRADLPRVFRTPLDIARASGSIRWRTTPESWRIESDDLAAANEDARVSADLDLEVPRDPARSPVMKFHA
ncbi:MAG: AsmA family protein, partial [Gammaproteobacteria bacterium]|nr:AsmA family protein [Gammaproteobacteria bacterium]